MARDCNGHECGMIASLCGGNLRTDHDDPGNNEDECTNENHDHNGSSDQNEQSDDNSGKSSWW